MSSLLAQHSAQIYQEELLLQTDKLRQERTLCDITILVENKEFQAHKIILSSACPFFRALFGNGMKESRSDFIELKEIDVSVMEDLLKFMYTGKVDLTTKNVHEMVFAADFLLLTRLKEICSNFLCETLSASTCFSTAGLAQTFRLETLQQAAARFTREHFVEATKSEEFVYLGCETVVELISDDDIEVSEEEQVFEAVVRWVEHDYEERKKHFEKLFKHIRISSISRNYLRTMHKQRVVSDSSWCREFLLEQMKSDLCETRTKRRASSKDAKLFVCRGGRKAILGKYNIIYHHSTDNPYDICKCATFENKVNYEQICG